MFSRRAGIGGREEYGTAGQPECDPPREQGAPVREQNDQALQHLLLLHRRTSGSRQGGGRVLPGGPDGCRLLHKTSAERSAPQVPRCDLEHLIPIRRHRLPSDYRSVFSPGARDMYRYVGTSGYLNSRAVGPLVLTFSIK